MDGLLIDSEPLWFEAEKAILAKIGIELTEQTVLDTRGLRTDEVVGYWFQRYPWTTYSSKEITEQIIDALISLVNEKANLQPGAEKILLMCRRLDYKIALVSSSHMRIIETVLNKFKLDYFDLVYSAEYEKKGKPDPAVYLTSCDKLNLEPAECLAFEDSLNGIMAAKSAGMACIAVPAKEERQDKRFQIADLILNSLEEVNENMFLDFFRK